MSPIIGLQYRLRELGRIRMGVQTSRGGKRVPKRLDTWRLTSASRELLEGAATAYGGTVQVWDDAPNEGEHFELISESDSLDIVIPPGSAAFSQFMELWSGGGCQRRCDGERQYTRDVACACPTDPGERRLEANAGRACKETTRFNVMLPKVGDIGVWRLETHGYYAAIELAGLAQLIEVMTAKGQMIVARLRIDQRSIKRPGAGVKRFTVPVVELSQQLGKLLEMAGVDPEGAAISLPAPVERRSLPGPPPPLPDDSDLPVGEDTSDVAAMPSVELPDADGLPQWAVNLRRRFGDEVFLEGINDVRASNKPQALAPKNSLREVQWDLIDENLALTIARAIKARTNQSEQGSTASGNAGKPSGTTPAQSAEGGDGAADEGEKVPTEQTVPSFSQHPCPECGTECVELPGGKTHWACPNGDFESYSTNPWKPDGEVEKILRRKNYTPKQIEVYDFLDGISAKKAIKSIASVTDRPTLELARVAENDRPKPRTTVLKKLDEQLASPKTTGVAS